ncbi:MAG TPA: recombinase family protein, partial [Symbiobacteriaceae bacterium]|nr:recombinase family protein [Symbiobacteriaceae bacterium]
KIFGYTYDSKTKTLTAKPEEAEVVRLIFQLYSEGKGIRVILNHLKEQGHRTRDGKDFSKSSVGRILDNPKYCGTLIRNRWDTGRVFVDKHSPRKRTDGELIEHEDHDQIEPIITKELFKACQEIREGKVSTQNQKGIYKGHSEYAGLIVCGKCGSSYTKNQDRGRVFYNCSRKKREGVSACDNPNVGLAQIEQFVKFTGLFDFIETVINHRDERCHQLWLKKESILSRKDTDKEQAVAGLVAQVETLERGLKALRGQLLKETISEEEFEETHAEQAQEKQALINQIEELRKDNDQLDAEARAIEAQIERLNQIDPDPTETLRIDQIRNEIKRIIVGRIPEGWFEPVLKVEYKVMDLIDEYANEKAQ